MATVRNLPGRRPFPWGEPPPILLCSTGGQHPGDEYLSLPIPLRRGRTSNHGSRETMHPSGLDGTRFVRHYILWGGGCGLTDIGESCIA